MATENPGTVISMKAADGSVAAYRVVTVSAADTVDVWQTSTSLILGVASRDASATNDAVPVIINGTAKCCCGASVSAGALVVPQTDTGKVIEGTKNYDTTTTAVPRVLGIALQAGSTNSVIEVALTPSNVRKDAFA